MMMPDLTHRLFRNDRIILTLFAIYGSIMGTIIYIDAVPPFDDDLYFVFLSMNFPAAALAAFMDIYLSGPQRFIIFHPVMVIPFTSGLWLFVGLMLYGLVRMLRLNAKD